MSRKLASVRRVAGFSPIENADKIHLAKIDGWNVITQKGWCDPNDLVAYFEIDSFLPVRQEFEFLRSKGFKSTKNLGDGFRLRTMKMRGEISQGLILPLSEVVNGVCKIEHWAADREWPTPDRKFYVCHECQRLLSEAQEGDDLTTFLGVQLYEKPIPTQLVGRVRGNFPMFVPKTDQERAQNLTQRLRQAWEDDEVFEITTKLDGSSMTVYRKDLYTGICSRNWDLSEEEEHEQKSAFWRCAKMHGLNLLVEKMQTDSGVNYALQGELMGPGVQNNREKLPDLDFYLYDIYNIDEQRYLPPHERLALAIYYKIKHVPVYRKSVSFREVVYSPGTMMEELLAFADTTSLNPDVVSEGLVFRREDGKFSFKVINTKFLLQEKD